MSGAVDTQTENHRYVVLPRWIDAAEGDSLEPANDGVSQVDRHLSYLLTDRRERVESEAWPAWTPRCRRKRPHHGSTPAPGAPAPVQAQLPHCPYCMAEAKIPSVHFGGVRYRLRWCMWVFLDGAGVGLAWSL